MLHDQIISRLAPLTAASMLAAAGMVLPAVADEYVCSSISSNTEVATVVFHPRLFGIDANEDDGAGDYHFEHRFGYTVRAFSYDPAKPGWTGPKLCEFTGGWHHDQEINVSHGGWREFVLNHIAYIHKVPRNAKLEIELNVIEYDSTSDNETLDLSPYGDRGLNLTIFVDEMVARTQVGEMEGRNDVTLNHAKRLVGNGSADTNAFIEFVANVHPENYNPSAPAGNSDYSANLPSPGQAVGPVTVTPGTMLLAVEPICRDYALKTVDFNQEAQRLGCGFQPPVWSNDHQMHFDWCMHGNNHTYAGNELVKRAAGLDQCAKQQAAATAGDLTLCAIYATEASASALKAQDWSCGFTGGRWSTDYAGHFAWCAAGAPKPVMLAESLARATSLASCAP